MVDICLGRGRGREWAGEEAERECCDFSARSEQQQKQEQPQPQNLQQLQQEEAAATAVEL